MHRDYFFFDRDISWLSFNERVLIEAQRESVPLLERMNFLSIFSSNLDEFYRVRMPALNALQNLYNKEKVNKGAANKYPDVLNRVKKIISHQQVLFGRMLSELVPLLQENDIEFLYGTPPPKEIMPATNDYFFTQVLAFLKPVFLSDKEACFFPENNRVYLAVTGHGKDGIEQIVIVNIPTDHLSRLLSLEDNKKQYIVFLDDIIRAHLYVLPGIEIKNCFSFKVTRDAEIDLDDDYEEDMAEMIERQIAKRDQALATRFLYEPGVSAKTLKRFLKMLGLPESVLVKGGRYHNLKDLSTNLFNQPGLNYKEMSSVHYPLPDDTSLLDHVAKNDILLHTPYHSYDMVLRFFNEAAISEDVDHIYLTTYRVARDSRILNALLSAAHNGKKVTVLIELKARFDEANNIKWSKKMKKAGIEVLYSRNDLKVHAKIALIKRKRGADALGLLSTGNLNESTARFYTDHILLTNHSGMLKELENVFRIFQKKEKTKNNVVFKHLLVAQYNLQERFLWLIEREITNAKQGLPARIILKMNNLEERVLIKKLYEASNAGVKIDLIIRSICCLVPGVSGMSENITVRRIVDRYLEHGRIYVFHNNGNNDVFLGSADWMNRNIYKRIEVCFPIYGQELKKEVLAIIEAQLTDNVQAVMIDKDLQNVPITGEVNIVRSQIEIYRRLSGAW